MPFKIKSPTIVSEKRAFRAYQKEAFERFKDKDSAFLAMEMRLGKSLVAIRLAIDTWKCGKIFIFAPSTALLGWEEECEKEGLACSSLVGIDNRLRTEIILEAKRGVFLINYEAVLDNGVGKAIEALPPDCLILDESTCVKNSGSQTTQFFLRVCDIISKKILLSGLPTPEDWKDIWSQCAILNSGHWMGTSNFYKWHAHHATPDTYGYFFTPKQGILIRDEFRKDAYCLSRKDANLGEIKIRQILSGDLPKPERRIYEKIQRDWEVEGLEIGPTETNYAMVVTSWLRRVCGGFIPSGEVGSWKYDALENLLRGDLRTEKAVVWAAFNGELFRAAKALSGSRSCQVITGADNIAERRRKISIFRSSKCNTLFIQQRLGRFGLDLSCSNVAIYLSNAYNLEHRAQSEDRIVMPGKTGPLLYIDMITRNTIEEQIYHDLRDKKVDAKWLVARTRKVDVDRSGNRRNRMGSVAG